MDFSSVEHAMIKAAAVSPQHLHAVIYNKMAELIADEEDVDAIVVGLSEAFEHDQSKVAGPAEAMALSQGMGRQGLISPGMYQALMLGSLLAGPVMAGVKYLSSQGDRDSALHRLQGVAPQLFQRDPQRAEAIFDAVWSSAPSIAKNTVLMSDLLKQMMAMPMLDLGTIAKLTDMAKQKAQVSSPLDASVESLTAGRSVFKDLGSPDPLGLAKGQPKISTVLNWNTEAAKQAGITDLFTSPAGGGTAMQQANQGFMMGQQQMGQTVLPLDAVVVELIAKEQELSQREEIIAQQEASLQQGLAQLQQMGSQYQQMTGVDPNNGQVVPEGGAGADGMEGAPEGEQAPEGAEQAMPEGEQATEGAEQAMPEGEQAPEGAEQAMPEGEQAPEGAEQAMPEGEQAPEGAEQAMPEGEQAPEGAEQAMPEGEQAPEGAEQALPEGEQAPEGAEQALPEGEQAPEGAEQALPEGEQAPEGAAPSPEDEHDMAAIQQLEAQGPNTAESVDGTTADAAHDAANKVEDGTPEDAVADQELAAVMNAEGVVPPSASGAAPAEAAPAGGSTQEIVVPLRISVKIGEADLAQQRAAALALYNAAISDLFTVRKQP